MLSKAACTQGAPSGQATTDDIAEKSNGSSISYLKSVSRRVYRGEGAYCKTVE